MVSEKKRALCQLSLAISQTTFWHSSTQYLFIGLFCRAGLVTLHSIFPRIQLRDTLSTKRHHETITLPMFKVWDIQSLRIFNVWEKTESTLTGANVISKHILKAITLYSDLYRIWKQTQLDNMPILCCGFWYTLL